MATVAQNSASKRKDDRTILHFDMDSFYASVFEVANPALRTLPLAVQQKHIIVTCNYEARRRGLHKLQLISEARRVCPDVVIVLGEDLTRFRDVSKELYAYLDSFSWNHRLEKLGFDEIFMDVSDMIDYNVQLLNRNDLEHSWFVLDREDPMRGFEFNAERPCGPTFPEEDTKLGGDLLLPNSALGYWHHEPHSEEGLHTRLILGSWLAQHLRHCLEEHTGYTATVGISTNKLLSKLVGNVNKPRSQTVLLPPYTSSENQPSNIVTFLASHDIAKIPGIGFKTAQKIRDHLLPAPIKPLLTQPYQPLSSDKKLTVSSFFAHPSISLYQLTTILSSPGTPHSLATTIWNLLLGIDDTEVKPARVIPRQISIEDSYLGLSTPAQVASELQTLAAKLLSRMRVDLKVGGAWRGIPRGLRLSTRIKVQHQMGEGRDASRASKSVPCPGFVLRDDNAAEKLGEVLMGMFKRLHPRGGVMSLLNVAVVGIEESGNGVNGVESGGGDIIDLFSRRRAWDVEDRDVPPDGLEFEREGGSGELEIQDAAEPSAGSDAAVLELPTPVEGSDGEPDLKPEFELVLGDSAPEEVVLDSQESVSQWQTQPDEQWDAGSEMDINVVPCATCGARMLPFAMTAHDRFHAVGDA